MNTQRNGTSETRNAARPLIFKHELTGEWQFGGANAAEPGIALHQRNARFHLNWWARNWCDKMNLRQREVT